MYFIHSEDHGVEPLLFYTRELALAAKQEIATLAAYTYSTLNIYYINDQDSLLSIAVLDKPR